MIIKLNCKKNEKYFSNGQIADNLSRREKKEFKEKYKNLRKTKILKKLPLRQWTKEELIDLIDMYSVYILIVAGLREYNIETLYNYIYKGSYERHSLYEEYRKDN